MKTHPFKTRDMENKNSIWDYVFHWNQYTKKWYAVHRDRYLDYWSTENDNFQSDEDINVLIKKLERP